MTPASAPVSRRVAPCAIFGEGVAVVTTGREIRLVGANWAEVRERARAAWVPGRKVCRLKGLCCFRSINPENTARQSRAEGRKCILFREGQRFFISDSGKREEIQGIFAERK